MEFNAPKKTKSIIKVIGVGGGGSNAVNHMFNLGIAGVDFVVCNTDSQALELSKVPKRLQLGQKLTEGLGAGANPEVGKKSAIETEESIVQMLQDDTKMVFITAGMGGGTGTGAAPVIAKVAKELGILTVGIATIPFSFEGKKRMEQADKGLENLKEYVDTLLVINNNKLRDTYGNLKMSEAFSKADDILAVAAKGIAEIITGSGYINVDFEDVKTVMKKGGTAIMSTVTTEGENRAMNAASEVLISPLLNDSEIKGAQHILINITSGDDEVTSDEVDEITGYIQGEAGNQADIIWGLCSNPNLGNKISVTVIATGFNSEESCQESDNSSNVTQELESYKSEQKVNKSVIEPKPIEDFITEDDFTTITSIKKDHELSETVEPEIKHQEILEEKEEITNSQTSDQQQEEISDDDTDSAFMDDLFTSKEEDLEKKRIEQDDDREENIETEEDFFDQDKQEEVEEQENNKSKIVTFGLEDTEEEIEKKSEELYKFDDIKKNDISPQIELFDSYSGTEENFHGPSYRDQRIEDSPESSENTKQVSLISRKLQSSEGILEIENTPAYKRKNVDIEANDMSDYRVDEQKGIKKRTPFIDKSID